MGRDLDPPRQRRSVRGTLEQCVAVPCVRARVSGYEAANARAEGGDRFLGIALLRERRARGVRVVGG